MGHNLIHYSTLVPGSHTLEPHIKPNPDPWWTQTLYNAAPAGISARIASADDIAYIAALEASVFSPVDAIPYATLLQWHTINPAAFTVFIHQQLPIGQLTLLPMRDITPLASGIITDREITAGDIYAPREAALVKDIYLESIIISPEHGELRRAALRLLLTSFDTFIARIVDTAAIERIFAVAASTSGERLLTQLGFQPQPSADRKDGHDLFMAYYPDVVTNIAGILSAA